jgi:entericidin B
MLERSSRASHTADAWQVPSETLMKIVFAFLVALAALAGCNTVEGMGRDLSAAGSAMSDSADDAKRRL